MNTITLVQSLTASIIIVDILFVYMYVLVYVCMYVRTGIYVYYHCNQLFPAQKHVIMYLCITIHH